jgi:4-hydroxy-tetrahydrodipicolinate synthase
MTREDPVRDLMVMTNVITPFTVAGALDEKALRAHLERLVDCGIGLYLGSPGTGDVHSLSLDEFRQICEIGVEVGLGRVPVHATTPELRDLSEMLRFAETAANAGVEEIQLWQYMGGHGIVLRPEEQRLYWHEVLKAFHHPAALSIHIFAGYQAAVALVKELCDTYEQVKTIKMGVTNPAQIITFRDALPERVQLGSDIAAGVQQILLGVTMLGGPLANVAPKTCRTLADCYLSGDIEELAEASRRLQRLSMALEPWGRPNSRGVKMALRVLGLPGGEGGLRWPLSLPPQEDLDVLAAHLARINVRKWEGL